MPQSSLIGWLSKPAPAESASHGSENEVQQVPTPPCTSEVGEEPLSENVSKHNYADPGLQRLPGLAPNVELRACKQEDIKAFKRLNSLLLPIPYGNSFYREIMEDEVTRNITMMAFWRNDPTSSEKEKGTLIGAIRCRLVPQPPGLPSSALRRDGPMLYLSTLVLLSPYRGHGIATKMLDVMVKRAVHDYGIASIGAHVWEANDEGLAWYRKRGLEEIRREEDYYRRLKPQCAVVMVKEVGVMDMVGG